MAYDINNSYFLDGKSLYGVFGIGVESGSADLLKFPDRKDSTSHDWLDENGIDIDLSRVFVSSREATFNMWLIAASEEDFWNKYNTFFGFVVKPGLRRLTITEHGKDYYVYYKKMGTLTRFTRIKETNEIALKFSVTFIEADPTTNTAPVFLVTQSGAFIIT